MHKKLVIPLLTIAFVMLATPVFASATTSPMYGALATNLYNPRTGYSMILDVVRYMDSSTSKYVTQMLISVFDLSSLTEYAFAVQYLGQGEFVWSMDYAVLCTTVNWFYFTNLVLPTHLTALWLAFGPVFDANGPTRNATVIAQLGGLTFHSTGSWPTILTINP